MKIFVSDVDGTLRTLEKGISNRTINAIGKIIENGDHFVLCSGRPTPSLVRTAKSFNEMGAHLKFVSGYNGCQLVEVKTGKMIYDYSLNLVETKYIVDIVDKLGYDYGIYDEENLYNNNVDNEHAIYESTGNQINNVKLKEVIASPKVIIYVDPEDNARILKEVSELLPEFHVVDTSPIFVEVMRKNINKATTLHKLCEIENVDIKNTYGFGDSGNDKELIMAANCGCVVKNGKKELFEHANEIIENAADDGVAIFLENYLNKIN